MLRDSERAETSSRINPSSLTALEATTSGVILVVTPLAEEDKITSLGADFSTSRLLLFV